MHFLKDWTSAALNAWRRPGVFWSGMLYLALPAIVFFLVAFTEGESALTNPSTFVSTISFIGIIIAFAGWYGSTRVHETHLGWHAFHHGVRTSWIGSFIATSILYFIVRFFMSWGETGFLVLVLLSWPLLFFLPAGGVLGANGLIKGLLFPFKHKSETFIVWSTSAFYWGLIIFSFYFLTELGYALQTIMGPLSALYFFALVCMGLFSIYAQSVFLARVLGKNVDVEAHHKKKAKHKKQKKQEKYNKHVSPHAHAAMKWVEHAEAEDEKAKGGPPRLYS